MDIADLVHAVSLATLRCLAARIGPSSVLPSCVPRRSRR